MVWDVTEVALLKDPFLNFVEVLVSSDGESHDVR